MPLHRLVVAVLLCAGLAVGAAGGSSASSSTTGSSTSLTVTLDPVEATALDWTTTATPTDVGEAITFSIEDAWAAHSSSWQVQLPPGDWLQLLSDGSVAVLRPWPTDGPVSADTPTTGAEPTASEGTSSASDGTEPGVSGELTATPDPDGVYYTDETVSTPSTDESMYAESGYSDPAALDGVSDTSAEADAKAAGSGDMSSDAQYSSDLEAVYDGANVAHPGADGLSALHDRLASLSGEIVAWLPAPTAVDAAGTSVPAWFSVDGDTITLTVDSGGWYDPNPYDSASPSESTTGSEDPGYRYPYGYAYPLQASSEAIANPDANRAPRAEWPNLAPPSCPTLGRVSTHNPHGWNRLVNAFATWPATCTRYYIEIPGNTGPRGTSPCNKYKRTFASGRAEGIRARNSWPAVRRAQSRFAAAASFHWCSWGLNSTARVNVREIARQFRTNMYNAGFRVAAGDTWVIDELPETVRRNGTMRDRFELLVRYLYRPSTSFRPAPGIAWVQVEWPEKRLDKVDTITSATETIREYKASLKDWSADPTFFASVRPYVQLWGTEVYTTCRFACLSGATVAQKATRVNQYMQHHARLAFAPGAPNTALEEYFDASYLPFGNAFWRNSTYRTESLSAGQMMRLVSLQIFATRSWAHSHDYPDRRIGFAWNEQAGTDSEVKGLAKRIAVGLQGAYSYNGQARFACSSNPRVTDRRLCDPVAPAPDWHADWDVFGSWN